MPPMKKIMIVPISLLAILSLNFKTNNMLKITKTAMPADTISALNKQKINTKSFFKAPNGKIYEVTFETPTEGLKKEKLDCVTDDFHGKARKIPKTTVVIAKTENFSVLKLFLGGLPKDKLMIENPIIESKPNERVIEEKRNVKLTKVFLIAVKREPDNDFHMIIGDASGNFFNTENTGLVSTSPKSLKDVRKKIITFMGGNFCSAKYQKFKPGIPIEIEGSLFYDTEHKPGIVGPADARPLTSWEIHPITNIVFK